MSETEEMTKDDIQKKLEDLLLGQEIESASGDTLRLKNGVELELYQSQYDCCAVADGSWAKGDAGVSGGITDVEFSTEDDNLETTFRITILHNGTMVGVGAGYADSGTGYYVSALSLRATLKGVEFEDFELIGSWGE